MCDRKVATLFLQEAREFSNAGLYVPSPVIKSLGKFKVAGPRGCFDNENLWENFVLSAREVIVLFRSLDWARLLKTLLLENFIF